MALAEREVRQVPDMTGWSQEQKLLWMLVRDEGTKVRVVAEAVGKSHSTISQYLSGTYASPKKLDPDIKKYLISIGRWQEAAEICADEDNKGTAYIRPTFVSTRDSARILGVCRRCWEQKEMGMLTGDPGSGKTYTFAHLSQYLSDLPYIVISCDQTSSKKSILVDTCEELGIPAKGSSATLLRRIVKQLAKRPHLLIYDEADIVKLEVYEAIRAIHDKANVGVVLCGNNNLAERILMYAENRPELARLRDRIGYYQRLTGLSVEEAEQFIAGLNATTGAKQMLVTIGTQRGIRQLTLGISRCLDAANGEKITEEMVEQLGSIVLSFNA